MHVDPESTRSGFESKLCREFLQGKFRDGIADYRAGCIRDVSREPADGMRSRSRFDIIQKVLTPIRIFTREEKRRERELGGVESTCARECRVSLFFGDEGDLGAGMCAARVGF